MCERGSRVEPPDAVAPKCPMAARPIADLFTPVVDRAKMHPNFVSILENGTQATKDVLQEWAAGFVDRDGENKFLKEFQTTFNACFWELYGHALLTSFGAVCDYSHVRPDYVVSSAALGDFCAEAVITQHPQGYRPEWEGDSLRDNLPRETLLDLACTRLAQAIRTKHAKWVNEYSKLGHCHGKPYVIFLAPFDQPNTWLQGTEAIDRVLFGGQRPVFERDLDVTSPLLGFTESDSVFKPSGEPVGLGLFRDTGMADVSAVLFSTLVTMSKLSALAANDGGEQVVFQAFRLFAGRGLVVSATSREEHGEKLVDGANLFVNPFACRPIDPAPWRSLGVATHYYQEGRPTLTDVPDGMLIMRNSWRLRSRAREPVEPQRLRFRPHSGGKLHNPSRPKDGTLFGGTSSYSGICSIELMLWSGWTAAVGFDVARGGWTVLLRPGTYLSFREFVAEVDELEIGEAVGPRDEIVAATKRAIDSASSNNRSKLTPASGLLFGEPVLGYGLHSVQLMHFRGFTVAVGLEHANEAWRALMKPGTFLSFDEFVANPQLVMATKDSGPRDQVIETAQEEIVLFLLRCQHDDEDDP
jgi:hypothetical protein